MTLSEALTLLRRSGGDPAVGDLMRLALVAQSDVEARDVLHDALLQRYPEAYGDYVDLTDRHARKGVIRVLELDTFALPQYEALRQPLSRGRTLWGPSRGIFATTPLRVLEFERNRLAPGGLARSASIQASRSSPGAVITYTSPRSSLTTAQYQKRRQ